ncbi:MULTISPECIES: hypothetical protein [unclassified Embleya]|uniref:hypothetical protein n=1 Tax=unclassified Embleya TaxID=2699296 RepID=UPI0033CDAEC1
MGGIGGALGCPRSDELVGPDGIGRRTRFEHGTIYWRLAGVGSNRRLLVQHPWVRGGMGALPHRLISTRWAMRPAGTSSAR